MGAVEDGMRYFKDLCRNYIGFLYEAGYFVVQWLKTWQRDRKRWHGQRFGTALLKKWRVGPESTAQNCGSSLALSVFYGHDHLPLSTEKASGGIIKSCDLARVFPNTVKNSSILYLVSSALPLFPERLVGFAKDAGVKIVWNQNGVAIEAYHQERVQKMNSRYKRLLHHADYVVYQSRFCVESANRYLGRRDGEWDVLYNPVDTVFFTPATHSLTGKKPVLLLGGSHHHRYRIMSALKGVAALKRRKLNVSLVIAGRLVWLGNEMECRNDVKRNCEDLQIADLVSIAGPYSQQQAVSVLQQADILLHTKYMDPCPRLVVEAMSCGLPVVYLESGGLPELVGMEAGVAVQVPKDWYTIHEMSQQGLADAVETILTDYEKYSRAARQRSVDMFDLKPWLEKHRLIFEKVYAQSSS